MCLYIYVVKLFQQGPKKELRFEKSVRISDVASRFEEMFKWKTKMTFFQSAVSLYYDTISISGL